MMQLFSFWRNPKPKEESAYKSVKYSNDDEYHGEIYNDKRHGKGTYKFANGNRYEGEWKNHLKHGIGKYYYTNGELYDGEWFQNKKHGIGNHFYLTGDRYHGQWFEGRKQGKGTIYFANNDIFVGNFEDNMRSGIGYHYDSQQKKYYEQNYKGDQMIEQQEIKEPPQDTWKQFHIQRDTPLKTSPVNTPSEVKNSEQEEQQTQNEQLGFDTLQVLENIEQIQQNERQRKMQDWQVQDVMDWLDQLGYSQYKEIFQTNQVTGQNLLNLTDQELKQELGISTLGHRKTIIHQVELYKKHYVQMMQRQLDNKQIDIPSSIQNPFHSIDNPKYNKLFSYLEKVEEVEQENINNETHSDDQKKKKRKNSESSSSSGDKKKKQRRDSSSSDKKTKRKKNRDSSSSDDKKRRDDDDNLEQSPPKLKRGKSKKVKKQHKRDAFKSNGDSADDEYQGDNSKQNSPSRNRETASQGNQGQADCRKQSQDSLKTIQTLNLDQPHLEQINEQIQSFQGESLSNRVSIKLVAKVSQDDIEEFNQQPPIQNPEDNKQQQHLIRTPQLEKKSQSEPLQLQKLDPPKSDSDSNASDNSSMISSSSSSDHKKRGIKHSNSNTRPKYDKLKSFNKSTHLGLLSEFGINENVLISFEELTIGAKIGEGGYGNVYKGKWLGQDVAIKSYGKGKSAGKLRYKHQMVGFLKEVGVISNLRHPNIVLYMGVCWKKINYYLITEYLEEGSLFDHLHKRQTKLSPKAIMKIVEDIALGMNYLHGRKVLHCDLKSSNVLIDQNWNVKLCDFGLSRLKKKMDKNKKGRRIGTPHWMAPEIMRGEPYQEQADVYSFGMILWEMITCSIPYEGFSQTQIIGTVGYGNGQVPIPQESDHKILLKLVKWCLNKDPSQRPNFNQIVQTIQKGQQEESQRKSKQLYILEQAIKQLIEFFE